jgi:non-specific serine/threonine protein kinase
VPASDAASEQAGMSEEAAAFAVLGTGIEGMTNAVARHFGLTEEVLHMIRRLPPDKPVRTPDGDADLLRAAASAANEVVDAVSQLAPSRLPQALDALAKRYNRALGINTRDVNDALQIARQALAGANAPDAMDGERWPASAAHPASPATSEPS